MIRHDEGTEMDQLRFQIAKAFNQSIITENDRADAWFNAERCRLLAAKLGRWWHFGMYTYERQELIRQAARWDMFNRNMVDQ